MSRACPNAYVDVMKSTEYTSILHISRREGRGGVVGKATFYKLHRIRTKPLANGWVLEHDCAWKITLFLAFPPSTTPSPPPSPHPQVFPLSLSLDSLHSHSAFLSKSTYWLAEWAPHCLRTRYILCCSRPLLISTLVFCQNQFLPFLLPPPTTPNTRYIFSFSFSTKWAPLIETFSRMSLFRSPPSPAMHDLWYECFDWLFWYVFMCLFVKVEFLRWRQSIISI